MNIVIDQTRQNENDKTVFFTLTDDNGISYKFHGDVPLDKDPQTHLDSQIRFIYKLILQKQYKGASFNDFEGQDELEKLQNWIAFGCKNFIGTDPEGEPIYKAIEKVPFKNTWK